VYQIIESEDRYGRHCRVVNNAYVVKKYELQIYSDIADYSSALSICSDCNANVAKLSHESVINTNKKEITCSQKK